MTTGRVVGGYACRLPADQTVLIGKAYGQDLENGQEQENKQAYQLSMSSQKQFALQ